MVAAGHWRELELYVIRVVPGGPPRQCDEARRPNALRSAPDSASGASLPLRIQLLWEALGAHAHADLEDADVGVKGESHPPREAAGRAEAGEGRPFPPTHQICAY